MVWRWDGTAGGERRRWKSDLRRSTDRPGREGLTPDAARREHERRALRRIESLARSLATVTNSYHDMGGEGRSPQHIAVGPMLDAMREISDTLTDAVKALERLP